MEETHGLHLEDRSRLTVSGVAEVLRFEETGVLLDTCRGKLLIRGEKLQLKKLTASGGEVAVEGTVTALIYEEPRREGGLFSRLFG